MKIKAHPQHFFLDKLAEGVVFSSATLIIGRILGFITTFLLARLGTELFGLYNLSFSIFSTVSILSLLGISIGVTRYISFFLGRGQKKQIKNVFLTALVIVLPFSLFLSSLIYFFPDSIAFLFKENQIAFYLKFFAMAIPFGVFIVLVKAVLSGFLKIKYLFLIENFEFLMILIFTAFFLSIGWQLTGGIIAYLISLILTSFLACFFLFRTISLKNPQFVFFKELVSFSWPVSLSEIIRNLALNADLWVLGFFKNASIIGVYSLGLALASLMLVLPQIFLQFFSPIISRFYGNHKKINDVYQMLTYWLFALLFPVFLFTILNGQQVIILFFGSEYTLSWGVLFFLSLSQLFFGLFIFGGRQILDVLKLTKYNLFLTILRIIIFSLLLLVLVPRWGMMGASLSLLIGFSVEAIFCLIKIFKKTGIFFLNRRYLATIFLAFLPCFLFISFPWLNFLNPFFRLFLNLFLYFLIYALLNMKFNLHEIDKVFLKSVLSKTKIRKL